MNPLNPSNNLKEQPDICPTCGGKCQAGYRPDLDNLAEPNSGQPSVDKILQPWFYEYPIAALKAKRELLAHALSCLPKKYDNYTGTDMEDYQKGFCEAVDLMEQKLRASYE